MDDDSLLDETVAQRTALAEVLAAQPEAGWDVPSLCTGWRVREVVAHITMPYRHSVRTVLAATVRARGRFDLAADRLARRDTDENPSARLLASLRENVHHRWKPPGGGRLGALSHDVIHGLDITEPLGVGPVSPPARIALVLASPKLSRAFGVDLSGRELVAADTDYRRGEGRPLELPAKDLLLVCTGRRPLSPLPRV